MNQNSQYQNEQSQSAIAIPIKININLNESKVPEIQYPQYGDPHFDFQFESFKLVQANAILSELIKQAIQDKYSISEKIIKINEHIKKLEARNNK